MKITLMALLVCLAGCQKYAVPAETSDQIFGVANAPVQTVPVARLTNKQQLALLAAEAKKRNLRYHIFCIGPPYGDPQGPERYQANAEHREAKDGAQYADEGRMDEWMIADNFTNQGDAAFGLYKAIQGAPTHLASKWFVRPPMEHGKHRQCLPEIKGNY